MLYPLSYEGGVHISAGQTVLVSFGGSARCPIPSRGVPVRTMTCNFLNCASTSPDERTFCRTKRDRSYQRPSSRPQPARRSDGRVCGASAVADADVRYGASSPLGRRDQGG